MCREIVDKNNTTTPSNPEIQQTTFESVEKTRLEVEKTRLELEMISAILVSEYEYKKKKRDVNTSSNTKGVDGDQAQ